MIAAERTMLRAVAANPHDDLPRLLYADWLRDTGDREAARRGEFIRCQVAGEPWEGDPPDEWVRSLLSIKPSAFLGASGMWRNDVIEWHWQRGFPNQFSARLSWLHDRAGGVFGLLAVTNLWVNPLDLRRDDDSQRVLLDRDITVSLLTRTGWLDQTRVGEAPSPVRRLLAAGRRLRDGHNRPSALSRVAGRHSLADSRRWPHPFDVCHSVEVAPTDEPPARCTQSWVSGANVEEACPGRLGREWSVQPPEVQNTRPSRIRVVCPECMTVYYAPILTIGRALRVLARKITGR